MKRIISTDGSRVFRRFSCLTLAALVAVPGCEKSDSASGTSGKLVIKGSNTIGEQLGPRLVAEYHKTRPDVVIDLESKGTATGFDALLHGKCSIAAASRVVTPDELALARSNNVDLNCYMIGSYAVAVVVNASNPVSNLSRDQVRDIFTGAIATWKQVGGPDQSIKLYARDPVSGTYLGFRELFMEDKPYANGITTFTNYESIANAVAKDPSGVGYTTIYLARQPGLKPLAIRGVLPDVLAVEESRYPFSRILRLYTDKKKEDAVCRDFIQFVQSPRGQAIVAELGYVPRP